MKKQISSSKKIIAIFALFLAAFTWGSAFCVLKDTLENVSPIWLLAFRFLLDHPVNKRQDRHIRSYNKGRFGRGRVLQSDRKEQKFKIQDNAHDDAKEI